MISPTCFCCSTSQTSADVPPSLPGNVRYAAHSRVDGLQVTACLQNLRPGPTPVAASLRASFATEAKFRALPASQ
eukprot:15473205-Alexandrium_andersonii.AAC.1